MKREEHALEFLDRPLPADVLAASLADLDHLNQRYGGHWLALREVMRRIDALPATGPPATIVDVGGGRGDFALRLVARAHERDRSIRVIVVDRDATAAALARRHCAHVPEITVVQGDATALPLRERGVDVAVSVLTLHHLDVDGAATMLAEMRAASRDALIVVDLPRRRLAWLAVWLTTRLQRCHPVSRHDGPLSVRRAYSVDELRTLADKARLANVTVRRFPLLLRVVLVAS
jgi:hypothetical protein